MEIKDTIKQIAMELFFNAGKQEGIKEVAKWIDNHSILMAEKASKDVRRGVNVDEWEAKLNEWGIK